MKIQTINISRIENNFIKNPLTHDTSRYYDLVIIS